MTNNIDKQSFGEAGATIVTDDVIPVGQYCAMQCVTEVLAVTLIAPLLSGSPLSEVTFPAGFILYTPIVSVSSSTGDITGTAIFYKAL
jgi:hypothetical protein